MSGYDEIGTHPSDESLALLAAGDCSRVSRFLIDRHLRKCHICLDRVADFALLRQDVAAAEMEDVNWDRLSAEMTANIHLGLEAGECVRISRSERGFSGSWRSPRFSVAMASLAILLGAGILLKVPHGAHLPYSASTLPVLESSHSGLELRAGGASLTLLNHHGTVADQTVSAQGEIRASYIDGGSVTINSLNVPLE
jgi:hypothetical protein